MMTKYYHQKYLRLSSDQISYFTKINIEMMVNNFSFNFIDKDNTDNCNYKLKYGIFLIKPYLEEFLLNSELGFIQVVFNVLQSLIDSECLYEKQKDLINEDILEKLFIISLKKNPLVYPFIKPIIISLASMIGFTNALLTQSAAKSFAYLSGFSNFKIIKMKEFTSSKNEFPLIMNLYYQLLQIHNFENTLKEHSSLYEKYSIINDEIFGSTTTTSKKNDDQILEGDIKNTNEYIYMIEYWEKIRNYGSLYLLYYYSILLDNENNFPYPKFLFVHDWMRQHFGGFRIVISKEGIESYENGEPNNEILYKSAILNNDVDLYCSFKLFGIFKFNESNCGRRNPYIERDVNTINENSNEKYKVFVHQISNNEKIEIPQTGENIHVSFPLEIIIESNNINKKLGKGCAFLIDFNESKQNLKECFIHNYDQIQDDFDHFISLKDYDK